MTNLNSKQNAASIKTDAKLNDEALNDGALTTPVSPEQLKQGNAQTANEIGGPAGPEPTRFGDWEVKGRCSDF